MHSIHTPILHFVILSVKSLIVFGINSKKFALFYKNKKLPSDVLGNFIVIRMDFFLCIF